MTNQHLSPSPLDRPGHPDGMTVPPGYFEKFTQQMADSLPPNDLEQSTVKTLQPPTAWQRMRPFVYMAAMFAGIWCMMKMFSIIRNSADNNSTDFIPGLIANVDNDETIFTYLADEYEQDDLLEDLYADGFNVDDFNF